MIERPALESLSWYPHISLPPRTNEIAGKLNCGYTPEAILTSWKRSVKDSPGLNVVLDLDENLFNTAYVWVSITNKFLKNVVHVPENELPDADLVFSEGGPSAFYPKAFPEIFPEVLDQKTQQPIHSYDEYFMDILRHLSKPNMVSPPLTENLPNVIRSINANGKLLGALTARTDTKTIVESTRRQLANAGVDCMDIIFKKHTTSLKMASQEKLDLLHDLANTEDAKGYVVLIDDSIGTAKIIGEHNKTDVRMRPVIQILNGNGPLTKPRIERGEFTEESNSGIFLMPDWNRLEPTLERVNTWIHSRNS